ncbi:MAG TPA: hypothetical protein VG742_10260 [Dongiaceae bacterium]|nr:hypothetical protein [Dongiaceae bacterium]
MHETHKVALWLIEPILDPADPAWQDRAVWREVVVAAESAALARQAAEQALIDPSWTHVGNESESRRAGLNDVTLYHVRELPAERRDRFPAEVAAGDILLASQLRPRQRILA